MTTDTSASALDTAVQAAEKPPAESSDAQPAVDEAPGSAETGESPKESRRDRRAERRIAKLSRNLSQEREEKAELVKRLDAVEAKVNAEPKPERPDRDNFETVVEYEDALMDYRDKLREPEAKPAEAKPKDDARTQRFVSFAAEMSKKDAEFAGVLDTADFPCDGQMLDNIMEMDEDGAKLFTHLQAHKDEATRLLTLDPERQARELDKIADNLASGAKTSKPAPEPIDPVSGGDEPPVNTAKMSDDQAVRHDLEAMKRRKVGR